MYAHCRAAFLLLLLVLPWSGSQAHDARPLYLNIEQRDAGLFDTTLSVPASVAPDNQPGVRWPDNCVRMSHSRTNTASAYRYRELIHCRGGLEGGRLAINYPGYNPSLATVIRLESQGQRARVTVLPPEVMEWSVPHRTGRWAVAFQYLRLGIEHILGGIDHLLFVTGLLLLARTLRRVVVVVSGFTVAHSITLSLAALKLVNVPVPPTEAAIALSILFLAAEIGRGREDTLAWRYPLLISSTFGLLHGLGFASALRSIGLPQGEIPLALLSFNLGVELGQIAFILCLWGLYLLLIRVSVRPPVAWQGLRPAMAYVLGIPASFWFIQRLAQFHSF